MQSRRELQSLLAPSDSVDVGVELRVIPGGLPGRFTRSEAERLLACLEFSLVLSVGFLWVGGGCGAGGGVGTLSRSK